MSDDPNFDHPLNTTDPKVITTILDGVMMLLKDSLPPNTDFILALYPKKFIGVCADGSTEYNIDIAHPHVASTVPPEHVESMIRHILHKIQDRKGDWHDCGSFRPT